MKRMFLSILACSLFLLGAAPGALAQQKERTPEEIASQEAERLETLLGLEGWQVFYVDSILKHDYKAMQDEFDRFQKEKVSSYNIYQGVQDKWMEKIDAAFCKLFTPEQWEAYLKQGAARQQKAREKRRAKAARQL